MTNTTLLRRCAFGCLLLLSLLSFGSADAAFAAEANLGDVFAGPPTTFEPWLSAARPAPAGVSRRLVVEERVGVARKGELVRAPLFFHESECPSPDHLLLFAADDAQRAHPLVIQADDIRRAANGQVARLHLYFEVDLEPWQRKDFVLVVAEKPQASPAPLPVKKEKDRVTLQGDELQVTFYTEGAKAGAIAAIQTAVGDVHLPHQQLAPRLVLARQDAELNQVRTTPLGYIGDQSPEVRDLRYGSGPLFAKLVVCIGPAGVPDNAEFTYLVPKRGNTFVQTERLFPTEESTDVVGTEMNFLLQGRLILGNVGDDQQIVQVPAGLRRLVRSVQQHATPALVNAQAGISMLPVPLVQVAVPKIEGGGTEGYISVMGPKFQRTSGANSGTLRSFWTQVRYVFSKAATVEQLWETSLPHRQPLTAVVEEPWLTRADLYERLAKLMTEWPPHHSRDWKQEVGRLYTEGSQEAFANRYARGGRKGETDPAAWLASAEAAREKISQGGAKRIMEWEKGKASAGLDPWHLTYGSSPVFLLSALAEPADHVDQVAVAIAQAQRQHNGRVDEFGFPYIDCFNSAFNMQIGSIIAGLHGGQRTSDNKLLQYYRDCARTQSVLDIYGNGERTYPSLRTEPGVSDRLYQMTSDFYLRMAEIASGEHLWLHPMVHGRFVDAADVNSDLIHRQLDPDSNQSASWRRGNFFRGQSHDHRWEAWATGPYARLIQQQEDGPLVGLTDACYYTDKIQGERKNWVEITTLFHADVATRPGLARPQAPAAPPLPTQVKVAHQGSGKGNQITWEAPAGKIRGYRVYRAPQMGGPWTLLNSPYQEPARPLVAETRLDDPSGEPTDVYHVTAVDESLRESCWFPNEPHPQRRN